MAANLRQLLIQRAARLQGRPALTAPGWGTLSWGAWRNRVEGVALGLLAGAPPAAIFSHTGTPWDWALEVAAACTGIPWRAEAAEPEATLFGSPRFNDDQGRHAYHDREASLDAATPFSGSLDHGAMMRKLQAWNRTLGWDHDTVVRAPAAGLGSEAVRAALWNALYAGAHTILYEAAPPAKGLLARFKKAPREVWDPSTFAGFWD
jgi:hypothetical protein